MANVNKVILIGNITRDVEIKYSPKGTAIADVGLAINRFIPASDGGEKREEVTFCDVVLFGRTAEVAGEYAKKGSPLYVEGRLQMDTWEDKTSGQKRSKLKVIGENIQLLGGKKSESRDDAPPSRNRESAPARRPAASEPEDDDIPF